MTRTLARRQEARRTGHRGERIAVLFLRLKGYRIVARNWRHPAAPAGEVDIIAARGTTLAFIEVKARASNEAGRHAATPHQQTRIVHAAEAFLASRPDCANMHVRFDLMVIAPFRWPDHIRAAWGYDHIT